MAHSSNRGRNPENTTENYSTQEEKSKRRSTIKRRGSQDELRQFEALLIELYTAQGFIELSERKSYYDLNEIVKETWEHRKSDEQRDIDEQEDYAEAFRQRNQGKKVTFKDDDGNEEEIDLSIYA